VRASPNRLEHRLFLAIVIMPPRRPGVLSFSRKWRNDIATSFELFVSAHLGIIALTFITPLVVSALARLCDGAVATRVAGWLFAALQVGNNIVRFILLRRNGELTISNGSASSKTVATPSARRARIAINPTHRAKSRAQKVRYPACYFPGLGEPPPLRVRLARARLWGGGDRPLRRPYGRIAASDRARGD